MSFDHKAFIFDYHAFADTLKPLLENALDTKETSEIKQFIGLNLSNLTDPYEGEALDDDWEAMLENHDVHEYGDFALTKFYAPIEDEGLGAYWQDFEPILSAHDKAMTSSFLGFPIVGTKGDAFDPGRMGSYFQSHDDVQQSLSVMCTLKNEIPEALSNPYNDFIEFLQQVARDGKGIYVTF